MPSVARSARSRRGLDVLEQARGLIANDVGRERGVILRSLRGRELDAPGSATLVGPGALVVDPGVYGDAQHDHDHDGQCRGVRDQPQEDEDLPAASPAATAVEAGAAAAGSGVRGCRWTARTRRAPRRSLSSNGAPSSRWITARAPGSGHAAEPLLRAPRPTVTEIAERQAALPAATERRNRAVPALPLLVLGCFVVAALSLAGPSAPDAGLVVLDRLGARRPCTSRSIPRRAPPGSPCRCCSPPRSRCSAPPRPSCGCSWPAPAASWPWGLSAYRIRGAACGPTTGHRGRGRGGSLDGERGLGALPRAWQRRAAERGTRARRDRPSPKRTPAPGGRARDAGGAGAAQLFPSCPCTRSGCCDAARRAWRRLSRSCSWCRCYGLAATGGARATRSRVARRRAASRSGRRTASRL